MKIIYWPLRVDFEHTSITFKFPTREDALVASDMLKKALGVKGLSLGEAVTLITKEDSR